ncbi:MAG: FecR family protein [Gammaproteobacteria bacterium]
MGSQRSTTPRGTLEEQAGYWIVRQHSGQWSQAERGAFEAWVAQSPAHRDAFERVQALWQGLDRFKGAPFPVLEARPRARTSGPHSRLALAASLALGLAVLALFVAGIDIRSWWSLEETYRTAKGERIGVELADGSHLDLNTDTQVTVRYSTARRAVALNRGEAFFSVVHDTARPFEVIALGGHIRDLGTRFNVRETSNRVEIAVIEGAVIIDTAQRAATRLTQGKRLSFNAAGEISAIDQADLAALSAWQSGQLLFHLTPLREVAAELTRYHAVEFTFDDPRLEDLRVSGLFKASDLPLLLATLKAVYPITLSVIEGRIIHLRSAKPGLESDHSKK